MTKIKRARTTPFQTILEQAKQAGATHYQTGGGRLYGFYRLGEGVLAWFSTSKGWVLGQWEHCPMPESATPLLREG